MRELDNQNPVEAGRSCYRKNPAVYGGSINTLFDDPGVARKDAGMAKATEGREAILEEARAVAMALATAHGEVTIDDVQAELARRGYQGNQLGNAAGSVFSKCFVKTGRYRKSNRPAMHAHENPVWRMK